MWVGCVCGGGEGGLEALIATTHTHTHNVTGAVPADPGSVQGAPDAAVSLPGRGHPPVRAFLGVWWMMCMAHARSGLPPPPNTRARIRIRILATTTTPSPVSQHTQRLTHTARPSWPPPRTCSTPSRTARRTPRPSSRAWTCVLRLAAGSILSVCISVSVWHHHVCLSACLNICVCNAYGSGGGGGGGCMFGIMSVCMSAYLRTTIVSMTSPRPRSIRLTVCLSVCLSVCLTV